MTDLHEPRPDAAALVRRYLDAAQASDRLAAFDGLREQLAASPASDWLAVAQPLLDGADESAGAGLLQIAIERFPDTVELRLAFARALWQIGRHDDAERLLSALARHRVAGHDAALLHAELLRGEGRIEAAAAVVETLHARSEDAAVKARCVEFLEQCQRQQRAFVLCERQLASGDRSAPLLAIAGDLALQLGRFDLARERFLAALALGVDINRWFVPAGLADAQRYSTSTHPDFKLFADNLRLPLLSARARASILYGLGKAYDDVADVAAAAASWRAANRLMAVEVPWSKDAWRSQVERALATPQRRHRLSTSPGFVPVFVVGLPRTGTTLVAELLARHEQVRGRGEMPALGFVAEGLDGAAHDEPLALAEGAALYARMIRQDDAPALAYVDKNPLNLRYLDLIDAMFPNALIVHCRRDLRDTALSLWSRSFANEEYAFSSDFEHIALFAEDCARLTTHARSHLRRPVLDVDYADLVRDPGAAMAPLFDALNLPMPDLAAPRSDDSAAIASASRWQARQPVHQRSLQRWRAYAPHVPELVQAFAGLDEHATT